EDFAQMREWARRRGVRLVLPLTERSCVLCNAQRAEWESAGVTLGCGDAEMLEAAFDKARTIRYAQDCGVRVPPTRVPASLGECVAAAEEVGFPCVVKPLDANHGKGATVGLTNIKQVREAFKTAQYYSNSPRKYVIIERQLIGEDFRALVVNNQLVAVAERTPAHVVGDGESTIAQLIDRVNSDPRRGYGHEKVLTQIIVDDQTKELLRAKDYTLATILNKGEKLVLKTTANISTGGTAIDRTDDVHPENVFLFERIAQIIGLDIAGVDVIAPDISTPLRENGGGIIEVNAAPGFRMHLSPSDGIGRNVAEHVVDMLFPPGRPYRIPIFSITGTNGKTTVTRFIAHILKNSGCTVGFTTTDGTYIGNNLIVSGDNTGPVSAQLVLKDPTVDVAVLETARGGIIRSGLGFDHSDIGVVTNIAADHLGLKDVNTLEDLARVKSVVPRSVSKRGFAVLNAEDDHVYGMRKLVEGSVALFSMDEHNERVQQHAEDGGVSCVYENGYVTLLKGKWKVRVEKVTNIPITFGGRAGFMIQNTLAAALACFVHGVSIEDIRTGLSTFTAGTAQTPGRLNFIEVGDSTVLMDYAHNPAGFTALIKFITKLPYKHRTVIVNGTGDRRDEDIREMGRLCAENFERIVIRRGNYLRGRGEHEMYELLKEGIGSDGKQPEVQVIPESDEAIRYALENARQGELIVALGDRVREDIDLIKRFRDEMNPIVPVD
ncbi:MAG: cyanophycin synthetase, partial [Acidobacteriota bacterium]|nr:cyanophycin synthetase [Acidobacteriota bacterium]